MPKYAFQVKVPAEGPLTREQGWAALDSLRCQMALIMDRMKAETVYHGGARGFAPHHECVLPEHELEEAQSVKSRLFRLVQMLGKDVLDQLAEIPAKDEEKSKTDFYGVDKYPTKLRWLLDDGNSDLYRFTRDEGTNAPLICALLEQEDWTPAEVGEFIEKRFSVNRKGGSWWSCPLCDENEPGYIDHDECPMCYGWGFVHGEEPDYDQFPESMEGRKAVAQNKDWTKAQEAEAYRIEWGEDEDD